MFYLIGIGLNPKQISLEAIEKLKECSEVYLDNYTSIYSEGKIEGLEGVLGKKIHKLCRKEIEWNANNWLLKAVKKNVALLVFGNALTATTHISLLKECKKNSINFYVIGGISVSNFVGITGLDEYKFGRIVSIVFPSNDYAPESFFDFIEKNKSIGLHTLCLLDIKADKKKFLKINKAINLLQKIEKRKKKNIISNSILIGLARVGANDMKIKIGKPNELKKFDFGKPPHSLIVCGKLNENEKENLKELFGVKL